MKTLQAPCIRLLVPCSLLSMFLLILYTTNYDSNSSVHYWRQLRNHQLDLTTGSVNVSLTTYHTYSEIACPWLTRTTKFELGLRKLLWWSNVEMRNTLISKFFLFKNRVSLPCSIMFQFKKLFNFAICSKNYSTYLMFILPFVKKWFDRRENKLPSLKRAKLRNFSIVQHT